MVISMRSLGSGWVNWTGLCLAASAVLGCQRLDDPESSSNDSSFETSFPGDGDDSGGPLLDSGGAPDDSGSDDGGTEFECDAVTNVPCGASEKCTAVTDGGSIAYTCVGEVGTRAIGQDCTVSLDDGLDGCVAGSVCLGDDAGSCRAHCNTDVDCTDGTCIADPRHDVRHCADDCSPFEMSCPGALQCRRQIERFSCIDARDGDIGGSGEPCVLEGDSGCAEGLMCVSGALVPDCASAGCCVTFCDLAGPDTCIAPATCTSALDAPAPGFESIGACFVPA